MPAVHALIESVEDPDPATLLGTAVAVRPVEGVRIRVTVPLNLFSAAMVTTELPVDPARIVMVVGLVVTVKSTTWTLTTAVWVRVPFEPVTVTV